MLITAMEKALRLQASLSKSPLKSEWGEPTLTLPHFTFLIHSALTWLPAENEKQPGLQGQSPLRAAPRDASHHGLLHRCQHVHLRNEDTEVPEAGRHVQGLLGRSMVRWPPVSRCCKQGGRWEANSKGFWELDGPGKASPPSQGTRG